MAVQGKVREAKEYKKSTGFFEAEVLCINPDREELEKLLGVTLEKDPEYLGTKEEEVELADGSKKTISIKKLDVVFWLRDVKTDAKRSVKFFLRDTPKLNRDKTKKQYINTIGTCSWVAKPEELPEWFTTREYRVANQGEENMYNFISKWLGKLDFKDPGSTLTFDWEKLMRGNVRELRDQINSEYSSTITCLCIITTVEKDGEKKDYEQVYNSDFLPGYVMKDIRLKLIDNVWIDKAKAVERKKRSPLQRFVVQAMDSEHGIKDYFTLGELQEYDPTKNVVAADVSHIREDDASY